VSPVGFPKMLEAHWQLPPQTQHQILVFVIVSFSSHLLSDIVISSSKESRQVKISHLPMVVC